MSELLELQKLLLHVHFGRYQAIVTVSVDGDFSSKTWGSFPGKAILEFWENGFHSL